MSNEENKKSGCHYGVLSLIIAVLLGLIFIVLVFKVGIIVGGSKSHSSPGDYKKSYSGHKKIGKKFSNVKKASFSGYKAVIELTDSGFVVKGADGKEQTVIVSEDTVIVKGKEKTGNEVSVGDKVYIVGSSIEASTVKIFDSSAKKFGE